MVLLTRDQVFDSLNKGRSLQGAEIGSIDFFNHKFESPAKFIGVTFKEWVNFANATFTEKAYFTGCTFARGVNFVNSQFYRDASFSSCHFLACAYFWRTHFFADATFQDAVIEITNEPCGPKLYPGEANFSWAMFYNAANFYRTRFRGDTFFWRTVFCDSVTFEEAKFEKPIIFEGTQYEVRISRRDFMNPQVFEILRQQPFIAFDEETSSREFVYFPGITTLEELDRCLKQSKNLDQTQIVEVQGVWGRLARPMFTSSAREISFKHVTFKEKTTFTSTNLDHCLFLHTDLSNVEFANVIWDKQRSFLRDRLAVYDERHAKEKLSKELVQSLYFQLKKNYEKRGLFREAGDFHYGEMEMERTSRQPPWRYISIATAYKYLSGYGEMYELTLFWLGLFIFVVFPLLFILSGVTASVGEAILHSLKVPAFLESRAHSTVESNILVGMLEVCERLVVYILLLLLATAAKRRLQKAFERE